MSTTAKPQSAALPEPEVGSAEEWKWLEVHPGSQYKQLFFKNRRLRPFTVWRGMLRSNLTVEEAAHNWDLPVEAVEEAIRYCESHEELLNAELAAERRRLEEDGYRLEPPPSRR